MNQRTFIPTGSLSATSAQQGIWLGQTLASTSRLYWTAEALVFEREVDVERLIDAIRAGVASCASLFSSYQQGAGGIVAQLHPASGEILEVVDLDDDNWQAWVARERLPAPQLDRGSLFHSVLLRCPTCTVWYLRAHHIALDGFGFHLLEERIAAQYNGVDSLSLSWEDRTSLERIVDDELKYRASPAFAQDRAHFTGTVLLSSAPIAVRKRVPCAQVCSAVQADASTWMERIGALAKDQGVEIASLLLAMTALFHARKSGEFEFRLGLASAGRHSPVLLRTPCMAMNILPVRVRLHGEITWGELCRDLDTQLKAARRHQRYRYEDLRRDLEEQGDKSPLFAGVLNYMPFSSLDFGGNLLSKVPIAAGPVEPWSLTILRTHRATRVTLAWDASEMDEGVCHDLLMKFMQVPAPLVEGAEHELTADCLVTDLLEPLAASTGTRLSVLHGDPLDGPVADVLDLIAHQARERPNAHALIHGHDTLNYAQLMSAVQRCSAILETLGVGRDALVAVQLPRSISAILAQLALMSLGAAFLPLDPDAPAARTEQVLRDSQVRWMICGDGFVGTCLGGQVQCVEWLRWFAPALIAGEPGISPAPSPPCASGPADRAYVIYTSGSTGQPRGVEIGRGALSHFVVAAQAVYGWDQSDRVLQFASLQFDASIEEIYGTLSTGGTLVLREEESLSSLAAFNELAEHQRITVLDLPTAFFHELCVAQLKLPSSVRMVIIGGEAVRQDAVARFIALYPNVRLFNSYGPTETTVVCCATQLLGACDEPPPLGQPLPGVTIALLDHAQQPCRRGEEGQIVVLGPTLANGYLHRDQDSAERFVPLCLDGVSRRAYLTGDFARMDAEGQLTFLGRKDDELKINGMRVRLLDIEHAILRHPDVQQVAVLNDGQHVPQFSAHYVAGGPILEDELRAHVLDVLPRVALPRRFVHHAALPRDRNGKVDRRALVARVMTHLGDPPTLDQPLSALGQTVLALFRGLLADRELQADSDLFEHGAHSLIALRAAHQLGQLVNRTVALGQLYTQRTVRALTASLESEKASFSAYQVYNERAPCLVLNEGRGAPLFCVYPVDGAALCYAPLAALLPDVRIIGIQSPLLEQQGRESDGSPLTFDDLVAHARQQIEAYCPGGPYRLLGWSSGGAIAHAVAADIERRGGQVELLVLLDTQPGSRWAHSAAPETIDALMMLLDDADAWFVENSGRAPDVQLLLERLLRPGSTLAHLSVEQIMARAEIARLHMLAYRAAQHPTYSGDVLYVRATHSLAGSPACAFAQYLVGKTRFIDVDATHLTMCGPTALAVVAEHLRSLV